MTNSPIFREVLGQGPDLVLIHGWAMHSGIWRGFARRLAKNFRVTLLDLPGHGRSQPIEQFSLDAVSIAMMENAPPMANWLGWSLGATIAMNIASLRPQRVISLITLSGNPKFVRGAGWRSGIDPTLLDDFSKELAFDKYRALKRFAGLQLQGSESKRRLLRKLFLNHSTYEFPSLSILQSGLDILRTTDLRFSLPSIRIPGLFLFGDNDRLVPPTAGKAMAALWPDAAVQVVSGGAHVLFLTHPKLCETAITEFILNGPQVS